MTGTQLTAIPAALAHSMTPPRLQATEAAHLLTYLATIPDPRAGRGRRHPLVAVLALAAAAVLTGARSWPRSPSGPRMSRR
jgi:hypothetical protein